MRHFEVEQTVTLSDGLLKLRPEQASVREHALTPEPGKGPSVYRIVRPVQFKAGERFGFDGPMNKALAALLIERKPIEKQEAKAA